MNRPSSVRRDARSSPCTRRRATTPFLLGSGACAAILACVDVAYAAGTHAQPGPPPQQSGHAAASTEESGRTIYSVEFFRDAQPDTAYDLVIRVPGFTFEEGGVARGLAGTGGNVLIDGERPLGKSASLRSTLERIPASHVLRLELIRRGSRDFDVQEWPVIVNVVRRPAAALTRTITVNSNLMSDGRWIPTLRHELNRRYGEQSLDVQLQTSGAVDYLAGDGWRRRADSTGDSPETATIESEGDGRFHEAKGSWRAPLLNGMLSVSALVRPGRWDFRESLDTSIGGERREYRQEDVDAEAGVFYERSMGRVQVNALLMQHISQVETRWERELAGTSSSFTSDSRAGESIARVSARWRGAEGFSMEWGGEGAFNFLNRRAGYEVDRNPAVLPSADARVEERRGEAFAWLFWQPTAGLSIDAGVRFETSRIGQKGDLAQSRSFTYFKPRLLAAWEPAPHHRIRVRGAREVGQLDFEDFASSVELQLDGVSAGNPALRPDEAWLFEVAYERSFWDRGAIVMLVRHSRMRHVQDRVPIFSVPSCDTVQGRPVIGFSTCRTVYDAPGNIDEGRSDELGVTLNVPLDRLGITGGLLRADATFRSSRVTDPTTRERRRISDQHSRDIVLTFNHDISRLQLSWGADVILPYSEASHRLAEVRHSEYSPTVILHVERKLSPRTSIRAAVNNASRFRFDHRRIVHDGNRATGPILFVEDRVLKSDVGFAVRLRHTF